MIRTVQITDISFDCSLDDCDWTEKDQMETEENLPKAYIGSVWDLEVGDDANDYEITEELLEEVSCSSGWCIESIDFRHILHCETYDANGNLTYRKDSNGKEEWWQYDTNGNLTHYKDSDGYESWRQHDTNGNCTHWKNSYGYEVWRQYDTNGKCTHFKNSDGYEWWRQYDTNGNFTHYKDSNGYEWWRQYDTNGNLTHYKNSKGKEEWYDADGYVINP